MGVDFRQQGLSRMTCRLCTARHMPCGHFDWQSAECALRRGGCTTSVMRNLARNWCTSGVCASFGCVSRRNEACLSDSGRRRCMAAAPLCMCCGRSALEDERPRRGGVRRARRLRAIRYVCVPDAVCGEPSVQARAAVTGETAPIFELESGRSVVCPEWQDAVLQRLAVVT